MISEYRQKVQDLFDRVSQLKRDNQQSSPDYHDAFKEMQRAWDVLKDLEQQQDRNKLFDETPLDLGAQKPHHNGSGGALQAQISKSTWSESQLYQLSHQVEAYKHLLLNQTVPPACKEKLALQTPDEWAYRRELIHQQTQHMYEERFEQNHQLNFHDLWEYITKKLQNDGENTLKVQADQQYIQSYVQHLNEVDEIQGISTQLEELVNNNDAPADEREKAEFMLKMLKLKPLQQKVREQILGRYLQNKVVLQNFKQQTQGDHLYERQLVDREFYKRAKTYQSTKKEARTLDRFEQQMRSGQELRKKTRHKELLNEILYHAKEFTEFHKKKQNAIKKKANNTKNSLDSKEKKEQMARDKEERERIKALKENNLDAYIDSLNEQKNTRLIQILEQTHKYLEQIGAKVHLQKSENSTLSDKRNNGEEEDGDQQKDEGETENNGELEEELAISSAERIKQNLKNSSNVYYSVTHTVKEEIKEQPKMIKGGQLKSYQLIGLKWMVSLYNNNLNGILADEMGLGKTIQTISLFCYLIESKGCEGPFLVVVPLTTISNWSMEFERWGPDIRKIIYKGKKHERPLLAQHLKNDKYHVVLTTYEYILNDKSTLSKINWQYIVVDEGHRMKNQKSKFALTLGQQYNSAHRILLTGTPLQNNLSELWALLNFLLPKIFSSCEEFQKWFDKPLSKVHPVTNNKLTANEKQAFDLSEEEQLLIINRLHQVLRPFLLRRVKSEVEKELPNKIETVIKVGLSAWQQIVYQGIQENGTLARDPSTGKFGNLALKNTVMQLRKICNHPYLFLDYHSLDPEEMRDNIFRTSGKFELLDRMLPKLIRTGHKILIFSQFTQLMDIMQRFFEYRGIKHLRLDGGTKHEDRSRYLQIFTDSTNDIQVFLLSTRAGGHGLNLQVADTVIIFDSDWNPQMDEQAKDRAHRIGTKNEVRIYRLITTTKIEEDILSKATMKKDLDAKIIQAGMFNSAASDNERQKRLEDLVRKDYEEEEDIEETEIPNDEQINAILSRGQKEYDLFVQMDQERYEEDRKDERMQEILSKMDNSKPINVNNINYRLMQEWEVPHWIRVQPEDPMKSITEFGAGKRIRKQVNYNDEISEGQWLRIIEAGGDPNQELAKRRQRKGPANQQSSTFTDNGGSDNGHATKRRKLGIDPYQSSSYISGDEYDEEDGDLQDQVPAPDPVKILNSRENGLTIQISKHDPGIGDSSNKRNQKAARKAGKHTVDKNGEDLNGDDDEEELLMSEDEDISPDAAAIMNGGKPSRRKANEFK